MRQVAGFALPVILALAVGFAVALAANHAARRDLDVRMAQYETRQRTDTEGALRRALSSRDMEIARLDARIDEQWREFYETLEARQPVLNKGK